MAEDNNTIKTTVELDASQAQQEIVKLNAAASDGTKTLEERIAAKNKQVQLQEQLSKKTISGLEKQIKALSKVEGGEKALIKAQSKLNSERLKATKLSESGIKAQNKLNQSLENAKKKTAAVAEAEESAAKAKAHSEKATVKLDDATGGLLGKMKAFVTNPIGAVIILIAGAFKLVSEAIGRSSKASETFNKIGAKLAGIFNGLLAVLEPVVEFIGDKLLKALNDPKQALIDLGKSIKENLINRVKSAMVFLEAFSLLMDGEFEAAAKKGADAMIQLGTGVENATDKIVEFGKEAKKNFDEAAKATEALANAEKQLARNRIALEKQQLKSLRLAEQERQIRDDTSKSIEERIEANTRLGKILDEQAQRELQIAQQNLNMANLQAQATGDTIENIEAIGDAEIKLLEIQERITGQRSEQLVNENSLLKEQADLKIAEQAKLKEFRDAEQAYADEQKAKKEEERLTEQEAQNELDELEIERKRDKGERTLELELELLERKRMQDVSVADLSASEIQVINERAAQSKKKVEDAEKKASIAKEKAVLDNALNGAAEAFGIAQEVAVAKMIMEAPQAVANSFSQAAQSYAPPISLVMGALGAAGTIVPIIKGLADIKKARFPRKSKKGGGGSSGGSISAPSSGGSAGSITPEVVTDLAANNSARLGVDPSIGGAAGSDAANNVVGGASSGVVFSESRYSDFQNQVQFREDRSSIS